MSSSFLASRDDDSFRSMDAMNSKQPVVSRNVAIVLGISAGALLVISIILGALLGKANYVMANEPNVGHIPSAFSGVIQQQHVGSEVTLPNLVGWNINQATGLNEVIWNWSQPSKFLRVVNYGGQQSMESASKCGSYSLDPTNRLHDYRAASIAPTSPASSTIQGRTCYGYTARRYDGSTFAYAVTAAGDLCQITDNGEIYTFMTDVVPAPTFYGSALCTPTAVKKEMQAPQKMNVSGRSLLSIGCDICQDAAAGALSLAAGAGCALISGGLAAAICGAAVAIGCQAADCGYDVCHFLGWC